MDLRRYERQKQAEMYVVYRPQPPEDLISLVIKQSPGRQMALDVGCGSGQVTRMLSPYFENVFGIDVSDAQLGQATRGNAQDNVQYQYGEAEDLDFDAESADLITVSDAVHWFDVPKFFEEAKRVLVPGGILAIMYSTPYEVSSDEKASEELNELLLETRNRLPWHERVIEAFAGHPNLPPLPFSLTKRIHGFERRAVGSLATLIGLIKSWCSYNDLQNRDSQQARELIEDFIQRFKKAGNFERLQDVENIKLQLKAPYNCIIGEK